jgi:hypothetical protein
MLGKTMGPNVLRMTVDVPDDVVHGMTLLWPS